MLTAKKALLVILTVVTLVAVASFGFSASAAECNHNIGDEYPDSTMVMFSERPATCVSEGAQAYQCTECTYITSIVTPVNPDNHTMSEWETVKEPTCKDEGDKIRHCLGCGKDESGKIPVSDIHVFIDESILDFWWTDENADVGTDYKGWTILVLPTCLTEGQAKTVCTVCDNAEKTAPLQIHSNSFRENAARRKEATCVKTGECYVYCEACNANYVLTIPVDAQKHVIAYTTVVEATCTAEGEEQEYCMWHKDYRGAKRAIPKKPHAFTNYTYNSDSTCTMDGTKTAKCDNCNEKNTVTAEGTKRKCLTMWFFDKGVTCSSGGKVMLDCIYSDCEVDHKEIRYISSGEHPNLRRYTVAPTCEEKGCTYNECPDCKIKTVVPGSEKAATGHKYNWVTVKDGSCILDNEGKPQPKIENGSCVYCGETKTRETAVDHKYVIVTPAVEATCNSDGRTAHLRCIDCFAEKPSVVIPAFEHNDADGNGCCDVCYEWFIKDPDGNSASCRCLCHNRDGLAAFFYKIYLFFIKLFGAAQVCDCGAIHY